MRRLVSFSSGLLALYLALAAAAFWTTWQAPTEQWIGNPVDPNLFIWYVGWVPFALTHAHDPLITNYLNFPEGFNLMWNTSVLFPAFALTPLTLLFGAVFSYNVLATLALALSGWCAYLAFKRYTGPAAAAVGSLLYGFGPFTFSQARDHPQLTFALFPPLVLLLLDEIVVRQRRSAIGMGCLLGVATALQILTGEEIAAATALVAAIGVALLALMHRREVRPRVPYAARSLLVAAVVALAIAGYPLGVQFFGSERFSGPVQLPDTFVADALEFIIPTPHQELTFAAANRVSGTFTGPSELDAYLGLPLLLLAASAVFRYRTDALVRFAAALGVVAAVLSLGPRLHVAGHSLPVRLPWVVPQRIPVLENILPARLAVFTLLLLALLVAVFVDRTRLPRPALAAILLLAFIPLIPDLPYPSQTAGSPPFFEAGAEQIPRGSVALVAPFAGLAAATARPMLWQVAADFRFRMPGGYVIKGRRRRDYALLRRLTQILNGEPTPVLSRKQRLALRCDLLRLQARTVVVGPMKVGEHETVVLFRTLLGHSPTAVGGVYLWRDVLVAARRGSSGCT